MPMSNGTTCPLGAGLHAIGVAFSESLITPNEVFPKVPADRPTLLAWRRAAVCGTFIYILNHGVDTLLTHILFLTLTLTKGKW